jgi:Sigma-70 region 2
MILNRAAAHPVDAAPKTAPSPYCDASAGKACCEADPKPTCSDGRFRASAGPVSRPPMSTLAAGEILATARAVSTRTRGETMDEQWWTATRSRLLGFIAARVDSEADAEDLVQNVLMKMARGLNSVEHIERIEAWAYRIARNEIADEYRRRRRHNTAVAQLSALTSVPTADLAATPVLAADLMELADCLEPLFE